MDATPQSKNKTMVAKLLALVVVMFAFAVVVMPPLYDAFCEITGLNGKTATQKAEATNTVVSDRLVTVQFLADTSTDMPWEFKPKVHQLKVHPGEITRVDFYVKNRSALDLVGQAIPSISPGRGSKFFKKTECFCFNEQPLESGHEADMPLVFFIDPDLPSDVNEITLAYKMFNITEKVKQNGDLAMQ